MEFKMPSAQDLLDCHQRIKPFIHRTPVMTSRLLNEITSAEVYFKCENFQRMGAFKMRGASNAILSLTDAQKARGVVTHSSGNFAQGVALAAREIDVKAFIVMPENAPQAKVDATRAYGAEVVLCQPNTMAREHGADKIATEKGATLLHPSNDMPVIIGQGTAAIELLEDHKDLDVIMTPVGGGGLIAGTALAANYFGKNCSIIGSEPFEADDAFRSLASGKIEQNKTSNTIADGLRSYLGNNNFPIIQAYVKEIIRVQEEEIIAAMKLIWERMKIIIEPSCAVPFAGLIREKEKFAGKKIGIILSGGNVDLGKLPF